MSNLYTVTIEARVVILAENQKRACEIAIQEISDISECEYETTCEGQIENVGMLPDGWESSCLPYGANNNKTIAEYLP